jgi:hypothetical protein
MNTNDVSLGGMAVEKPTLAGDYEDTNQMMAFMQARWYGWASPVGLGMFILFLAVSIAVIRVVWVAFK